MSRVQTPEGGEPVVPATLDDKPARASSVQPPRKKTGGKKVDAAVLQALGGVGNASMLDDDGTIGGRVLLYRLVALSRQGPWGDGLLLNLARATDDDVELKVNLFKFLAEEWRTDDIRLTFQPVASEASMKAAEANEPARSSIMSVMAHAVHAAHDVVHDFASVVVQQVVDGYHSHTGGGDHNEDRENQLSSLMAHDIPSGKTWSDVLLHGRGTVGETALHLCCLLGTKEHKRLVKLLVPWLATQRTVELRKLRCSRIAASPK